MTASEMQDSTGAATGGIRTLLRIEGLTLFLGMTMLYGVWGGSWWIYVVLFLVPDISFVAYLGGPRVGATVYNAMHTYMLPLILSFAGFGLALPLTLSISMKDVTLSDDITKRLCADTALPWKRFKV